ncbi:hypothetical protein PanWU01x14_246050, partial [Parasponia andersonii]
GGSVYALRHLIVYLEFGKYKEVGEPWGIAFEKHDIASMLLFKDQNSFISLVTSMNEKLEKLCDISDVIIGLLLRSI